MKYKLQGYFFVFFLFTSDYELSWPRNIGFEILRRLVFSRAVQPGRGGKEKKSEGRKSQSVPETVGLQEDEKTLKVWVSARNLNVTETANGEKKPISDISPFLRGHSAPTGVYYTSVLYCMYPQARNPRKPSCVQVKVALQRPAELLWTQGGRGIQKRLTTLNTHSTCPMNTNMRQIYSTEVQRCGRDLASRRGLWP